MLDLNGNLFTQSRSVPLGSNFPSNLEGDQGGVPRSCVVGIRRIDDERDDENDDDDDDDGDDNDD